MSPKDAELLLPGYRPGIEHEGRIRSAVRAAGRDAALGQALKEQSQFDDRMVQIIRSIRPPEEIRRRLGAPPAREKPSMRSQLFQPAMLPVWLGLLILAGLLVWLEMDRQKNFPGREAVLRLVNTTKGMTGLEFEQVSAPAWQLGDWYYMRGFDSYALPAELADLQAVGSRVFRQDGKPVAQLAADQNSSIICVFRAADFGVDLPEDSGWRVLEHDGWTGALRKQGATCTLVAFRGKSRDMHQFLESMKKDK